ncbi:hypothetical protein M405DRAFT_599992 [Rhizopogon salebrosus TDB-379]|nr:hypothetical protein M405DRAFT_599992 [Rhizopogon salebrosus TDB-379]
MFSSIWFMMLVLMEEVITPAEYRVRTLCRSWRATNHFGLNGEEFSGLTHMSAFSTGIEVLIEFKTYAQALLYFDWPDYVLMTSQH